MPPPRTEDEILELARHAVRLYRQRYPDATEQEVEEGAMEVMSRAHGLLDESSERAIVFQLGERIGYGRVMQLCEQIWAEKLEESGGSGGELAHLHLVGPCAVMLVECPGPQHEEGHPDFPHCDWCCGSHKVTKRVAQAITGEAVKKVAVPHDGPSRYEVITSED